MRKLLLPLVIALTLAPLAGCEHEGAIPAPEWQREQPPDPNELGLTVQGGRSLGARVEDSDVTGPDVAFSRYAEGEGGAIRGRAFRGTVDVEVTADGASGLYGSAPLNIHVESEGKTLRVNGIIRGHLSTFALSPAAMKGTIGKCGYELVRTGATYDGHRSCGGGIEPVSLRLPASFDRWRPAEVGVALGILLGS